MRFRRWPRVMAYEDTTRKRAALACSQRLQREKLPLFADLIAARQPSEWVCGARRREQHLLHSRGMGNDNGPFRKRFAQPDFQESVAGVSERGKLNGDTTKEPFAHHRVPRFGSR